MAVAAVHTAVLLGSTIATAGLGMAVVGLVSSALTLADVIHGWHKKNQGFSVAPFMDFLEFNLEPKCYAAISVLSAAKAREYQWKTTKNIDVVTLKVLRYFDPDVTLQSEEEGVAAKLKVLKRVLKKRNRCTGADGEAQHCPANARPRCCKWKRFDLATADFGGKVEALKNLHALGINKKKVPEIEAQKARLYHQTDLLAHSIFIRLSIAYAVLNDLMRDLSWEFKDAMVSVATFTHSKNGVDKAIATAKVTVSVWKKVVTAEGVLDAAQSVGEHFAEKAAKDLLKKLIKDVPKAIKGKKKVDPKTKAALDAAINELGLVAENFRASPNPNPDPNPQRNTDPEANPVPNTDPNPNPVVPETETVPE